MKKIYLRNTKKYTFIDDEDWVKTKDYRWYDDHGYVRSGSFGKKIYLHRLVMDFPEGQIDHKNRNPLDNRKVNLRVCSDMDNKRNMAAYKNNKSGYKGVTLFKGKYWRATIVVDKQQKALGHYVSALEAAKAYDKAALKYFGEFARINGA